jgi:hypothetical protein
MGRCVVSASGQVIVIYFTVYNTQVCNVKGIRNSVTQFI